MKSLLIVTEIFDIGGLETSIRGEIVALTHAGCHVHLATGPRFNPMLLPKEVASVTHNLSLGPDTSVVNFIHTVDQLRRLIRQHAIDCVHAHPFASMLPALIAAELEGVQCALTLHGPASLGACYGPIYDFFLTSVILPNAGLVIAVSEETAELASPYLTNRKALILPNGVDFNIISSFSMPTYIDPRWLAVSRLDPFKIVGIADFIRKAKLAGIPGVLVAGDGPARRDLELCLNNEGLTDFVEFCGVRADVPQLMQSATGIAGMGRVALEGIVCRKPVCLVGYDGVKGLIHRNLLASASKANFSGRNLKSIDDRLFCEQFEHLSKINVDTLHRKVSTKFSESSIWRCFLENVEKTKPQMATLLSEIYHVLLASDANEATPLLQSEIVLRHLGELIHDDKYSKPSLIAKFQHYHDRFLELKPHHKNTQTGKKISSLDQFARQFHSELATIDQAVLDRDKHITEIAQAIAEKKNVHVGKLASIANQRQHESSALLKQLEQIRQQRSWQFTRSLTVIARGFMCSLWGAGRKICRHVRRWLAPWFVV